MSTHRLPLLLSAASGLFGPVTTLAADKRTDSNGNLCLNYVGDHAISHGPWGLHLEVQTRRCGSWPNLRGPLFFVPGLRLFSV